MIRWLVIGALMAAGAGWAGPAVAVTAAIVTTAPLGTDDSEEGLKAAAAVALSRAVRGAQAMGLDHVMLRSIRVVPGSGVVVEVIATDNEGGPIEPSRMEVPKPTL